MGCGFDGRRHVLWANHRQWLAGDVAGWQAYFASRASPDRAAASFLLGLGVLAVCLLVLLCAGMLGRHIIRAVSKRCR